MKMTYHHHLYQFNNFKLSDVFHCLDFYVRPKLLIVHNQKLSSERIHTCKFFLNYSSYNFIKFFFLGMFIYVVINYPVLTYQHGKLKKPNKLKMRMKKKLIQLQHNLQISKNLIQNLFMQLLKKPKKNYTHVESSNLNHGYPVEELTLDHLMEHTQVSAKPIKMLFFKPIHHISLN